MLEVIQSIKCLGHLLDHIVRQEIVGFCVGSFVKYHSSVKAVFRLLISLL